MSSRLTSAVRDVPVAPRGRRWRHTRAALGGAAGIVAAGALAPATASAHGLVGRTDLPIPPWLFAWAAAVVLIVSFVALGLLWPRPRLQLPALRPVLTVPRWVEPLCGAIGIAIFAITVYAGLAGTSVPTANLAPTAIFVAFWVGIPLTSAVLGDWFAAFNPWRAVYRGAMAIFTRLSSELRDADPLPYPARLGRWPAVAGLAAFGWLELVYVNRDDPAILAGLALAYAAVQLVGLCLFGDRQWTSRGDAFGVYFGTVARLSPLTVTADRRLALRRPLSGAPGLDVVPGTVALLCVLIGTTTFDGASNGGLWVDVAPKLQDAFHSLGLSQTAASEVAFTAGLAAAIAFVSAIWWVGIRGMRTVQARRSQDDLSHAFVHTLIPIAVAYALAHYFSLLVFQGQALGYLVSDPLGHGSDLLGTASWQVSYTLLSTSAIWYVQVAALVAGHVAGLVLAHDRALAVFAGGAAAGAAGDDAAARQAATRSQHWMLVVMVGFTCLGLWLLSAVNT